MWRTDPPGHADALTAQWHAFAHRSGLALADVYIEQTDVSASRAGATFRAPVQALRRPHTPTVIIPAPEHFSQFGGMHRPMCTFIHVETGVDLLIVSEYGRGAS